MTDDAAMFESNRPALLALAYRMLGEVARAEDVIQEAWVRWQQRKTEVDEPKAFLITTVARLCLDELGSARARREESRSDRLPEPVDLDEAGIGPDRRADRGLYLAGPVGAARFPRAHAQRRACHGPLPRRPRAGGHAGFGSRPKDPPRVLPGRPGTPAPHRTAELITFQAAISSSSA